MPGNPVDDEEGSMTRTKPTQRSIEASTEYEKFGQILAESFDLKAKWGDKNDLLNL